MKLLITIFLLISFLLKIGAQGTALYSDEGYLRIDTSYSINPDLLKTVKALEKSLGFIIEDIEYPEIEAENDIDGLIIAKIYIDYERLSVYCEVKDNNSHFGKSVITAVHKNSIGLLRAAKGTNRFYFYVPFIFDVTIKTYEDDLEENRAIMIRKFHLEPKPFLLSDEKIEEK